MQQRHIGPFVDTSLELNAAEPPVTRTETLLPLRPVEAHNMRLVEGYWRGTDSDSYLLFSVPSAPLAGVVLTYTQQSPWLVPARLQVAWADPPGSDFAQQGHHFTSWFGALGAQQQLRVWIDDRVSVLRVTPDNKPSSFRLDGIVLLRP
jgi:hypothetical protein